MYIKRLYIYYTFLLYIVWALLNELEVFCGKVKQKYSYIYIYTIK